MPASARASGARPATFTAAGMRRGFVAAQPIAFGTFVYGATFGLLALGVGRTALEALAMSVGIYSGSAQTVALGLLATGASLATTVATVLLVNARYVLYGASLRPWLAGLGAARCYGMLFVLGDGNWLLATQARERGEEDAGFVLGSGLACYFAWLLGTLAGSGAGRSVPRPEALGLDFLLVAFCAAMMMAMIRSRAQRLTALVAAVALAAALAADRLLGPGWAVLLAGLAGVVTAYACHRAPAVPAP